MELVRFIKKKMMEVSSSHHGWCERRHNGWNSPLLCSLCGHLHQCRVSVRCYYSGSAVLYAHCALTLHWSKWLHTEQGNGELRLKSRVSKGNLFSSCSKLPFFQPCCLSSPFGASLAFLLEIVAFWWKGNLCLSFPCGRVVSLRLK